MNLYIILKIIQITMGLEIILKIIQTAASTLAATTIVIALVSYFYNKNRNNCVAAIDQISFFRKEILPVSSELVLLIREKKGNDYDIPKIILNEATLKYAKSNFLKESREQIDLFLGTENKKIFSKVIEILNILEELSLKILHFKTINHQALNCIKVSFVNIVESNALVLLLQREVVSGKLSYSEILEVYNEWKDLPDRRTMKERAQELVKNLNE